MFNQQTLVAVVGGDLKAFATLLKQPPGKIDDLRDLLPKLTVTSEGVLRVLKALQNKDFSAEFIQQWASFIRRGYFGSVDGPRRPIYIQYDPSTEDQLVNIIGRLDELGDLIDGEITDEELVRMIESISAK
jgi:DNA-binding MarR family transcriptional regulator